MLNAFTLHNGAPLLKVAGVEIHTGEGDIVYDEDGTGLTVISCVLVSVHPAALIPITV
jgi:hypothetical protein